MCPDKNRLKPHNGQKTRKSNTITQQLAKITDLQNLCASSNLYVATAAYLPSDGYIPVYYECNILRKACSCRIPPLIVAFGATFMQRFLEKRNFDLRVLAPDRFWRSEGWAEEHTTLYVRCILVAQKVAGCRAQASEEMFPEMIEHILGYKLGDLIAFEMKLGHALGWKFLKLRHQTNV